MHVSVISKELSRWVAAPLRGQPGVECGHHSGVYLSLDHLDSTPYFSPCLPEGPGTKKATV